MHLSILYFVVGVVQSLKLGLVAPPRHQPFEKSLGLLEIPLESVGGSLLQLFGYLVRPQWSHVVGLEVG